MKVKRFCSKKMFSCNVFIVSSEKGNFIIDLGYFDKEIDNYIKSIGGISFVLTTHGHYDHIFGLNDFHELYPNVPIYAYREEMDVIYNPRKSHSFNHPERRNYIPDFNLIDLDEASYNLNEIKFDVIHTPGHTKGGVLYYFKEDNILFTGDTIIGESIGRYDLPTGSEVELYDSLNKIKGLNIKDEVMIYSGHGESYPYGKLKKFNIYLR